MIDLGLYVSYFLLIIALAACILLPLLGSIQNPKALVKSLMGVGGLLVLFGIGYVMSGSEVTAKYTALGVGEGGSKMIGAGLITFYIILILAFVGVIFSEINKALK